MNMRGRQRLESSCFRQRSDYLFITIPDTADARGRCPLQPGHFRYQHGLLLFDCGLLSGFTTVMIPKVCPSTQTVQVSAWSSPVRTPVMNMFLDRGFAIVVLFFPAEVHGCILRVARQFRSHLGLLAVSTPVMNMFLVRGFAIVVLFFPAEVHGSILRVAKRSSHLGRWLEGSWACLCTQPKKAIPSVDKAQVHVHMVVACTLTFLINAHISVPFPQVGRGLRARILAMDKEVAVRSREDIFLQLMSTMNGTSTSVLLVLLFIAKNIGTPVQMAKSSRCEWWNLAPEVRAPSLRVFIFTDTTVVPGLGISLRLVNADQICCMF